MSENEETNHANGGSSTSVYIYKWDRNTNETLQIERNLNWNNNNETIYNVGNIKTHPDTSGVNDGASGSSFFDSNFSAAVVSMGTVAVVIGTVALLWKLLKPSSGTGCTPATSAPPPPPNSPARSPEQSIYERHLSIYNTVNSDTESDTVLDLNNNVNIFCTARSPHLNLNDLNKKDDCDPYILDDTIRQGCSTSFISSHSRSENRSTTNSNEQDSCIEITGGKYRVDVPAIQKLPVKSYHQQITAV